MLLRLALILGTSFLVYGQNAVPNPEVHYEFHGSQAVPVGVQIIPQHRPTVLLPSTFKTEPGIRPENFVSISNTSDHSLLADGYLFIDPMYGASRQGGPQIYDTNGNLVWQGLHLNESMNLHVCDYLGQKQNHLCYHEKFDTRRMSGALNTIPPGLPVPNPVALSTPIRDFGRNIILDQTYSPVGHGFTDLVDGLPVNGHVFQMLQGGDTFLGLSDQPTVMDLQPYGYTAGLGWVENQCFSETDVQTGNQIFKWCYLESGLPVWETQTFFFSPLQKTNSTEGKVGTGTFLFPWDFLHINSVDKNSDGDYYVSFRHGNQIIKVAGTRSASPGSVLWRLGGRSNDFDLVDFPFEPPFSRQHDVRWISTKDSVETISIFNNAYDGEGRSSQFFSDGQIIQINNQNMTARLERSYPHPQRALSGGRGNMQILPNKNVLIGWGTINEITEYHENGTILYHAKFTGVDTLYPDLTYRAYKAPWKGVPNGAPKLVAYSLGCGSDVIAYVSWNGATEIRSWRFQSGPTRSGPWIPAGTFVKEGFETQAKLKRSRLLGAFVKAEAIDSNGNPIGLIVNQTFVPRSNIKELCDEAFCSPATIFFNPTNCEAWQCQTANRLAVAALVMLLLAVEGLGILENLISSQIAFWLTSYPNISSYV